ncbi:MAG: hypothetical protein ACO3BI_04005 [Candidatus Nanopelagicales bacterium]
MNILKSKHYLGLVSLTLGTLFVGGLWIWLSPYVECYVNERTCVYYVERNSDFFVADFLFAFLMFLLGTVLGFLYKKSWWQAGIWFQLGVAAYSILLSIFVALVGQFVRPLTMLNDLQADAGLELRTLGAIFVLPAVIQVIITITGLTRGHESEQGESDE